MLENPDDILVASAGANPPNRETDSGKKSEWLDSGTQLRVNLNCTFRCVSVAIDVLP